MSPPSDPAIGCEEHWRYVVVCLNTLPGSRQHFGVSNGAQAQSSVLPLTKLASTGRLIVRLSPEGNGCCPTEHHHAVSVPSQQSPASTNAVSSYLNNRRSSRFRSQLL